MYCEKCGADNSETATFCRKCGVRIGEGEEETRVAVRPGVDNGQRIVESGRQGDRGYLPPHGRNMETVAREGGEQGTEIFSISPTLMFIKAGYVAAGVGALFLVAVVSFLFPSVSTSLAVLLGLMLFLIPAFYHFRRKLVRYTLTDSKLEIDTGLISRTTRNIPIGRIQDVTVSASLMQRVLGFGDIVIDNASDLGGKAMMKNVNSPKHYADLLLRQMRDIER